MPAAPRARQLRRDKTVFSLLMNVVRLHLEEDDRLARQPQLRDFPDAELLQLQQVADQWLGLAIAYIMQKHKCPMPTALRVIGEVQADLKASIPAAEVRAVPLSAVLELPAELQGR
ncbi:hypothetical protein Q5H93_20500 [Hymenobacter sp. ASUV-10]|uniref:Uncharacterized protein n=1 Tax=Hymenobacter aranciens TaxID=3063996 RepID=A0ABT9BKS5_9BACT|nr:hypothetical protein [Hymenobacter sp. ASUV-10]MDO7877138.1 hypothetical protein [Hymenobacter sp. ASUV-10]